MNPLANDLVERVLGAAQAAAQAGNQVALDAIKVEVLRLSIINLGRLLPPGMELHFFHQEGNEPFAAAELWYPDGSTQVMRFTGHSPIYTVPEINAEVLNHSDFEGAH